jgi:hypothetical protein
MNMMTMLLLRAKWRRLTGIFETTLDKPFKEIPPRSMDTNTQRQMYPPLHHPPATRVAVAASDTAVVMSDWRGE